MTMKKVLKALNIYQGILEKKGLQFVFWHARIDGKELTKETFTLEAAIEADNVIYEAVREADEYIAMHGIDSEFAALPNAKLSHAANNNL